MSEKLILAGYGFVGKAVHSALSPHFEIVVSDPKYNGTKVSDFSTLEGVIICVPTPEEEDGSCDVSYIDAVLKDCAPDTKVLIKSTMSIEGYRRLKAAYPNLSITYSPEFLTAANSVEDFANQKSIYLAGDCVDLWSTVFCTALPDAIIKTATSVEELILVKYFRNSFLATKVAYANQMYDACEKMGVSYTKLREKFGEDPRIGYNHTNVPGVDGRGFGGACFPKDTAALIKTADIYGLDLSIIEAAVNYNNKVKN